MWLWRVSKVVDSGGGGVNIAVRGVLRDRGAGDDVRLTLLFKCVSTVQDLESRKCGETYEMVQSRIVV